MGLGSHKRRDPIASLYMSYFYPFPYFLTLQDRFHNITGILLDPGLKNLYLFA